MYGGFYDSNVIQPHMECQRQRQNAAGILGGYTPSRRTTPPFVGAFYNPRTCEQAVTQPPARQENNGSRSAPLPFPSSELLLVPLPGGSWRQHISVSHHFPLPVIEGPLFYWISVLNARGVNHPEFRNPIDMDA